MVAPSHPCPFRGDSSQGGLREDVFPGCRSNQQGLWAPDPFLDTHPPIPSSRHLEDKCAYTHLLPISPLTDLFPVGGELPLRHPRKEALC